MRLDGIRSSYKKAYSANDAYKQLERLENQSNADEIYRFTYVCGSTYLLTMPLNMIK